VQIKNERIWFALTGQNIIGGMLPWALPTAAMVQAVGLILFSIITENINMFLIECASAQIQKILFG
jgi:hypothetical protein